MPTSIRLDPNAESLLRRLAKHRRQTKSEVVRAAIHSLAREAEQGTEGRGRRATTAHDRLAHIVGIADSGSARLSEDTGAKFRSLLRTKPRGTRCSLMPDR